MMKPEPSPGVICSWVPPPPKNQSNGAAATRCTTSVCTVTTVGETRATASVMAVRRCALTASGDGSVARDDCALDDAGATPSQASRRPAQRGVKARYVISCAAALGDG